MKNLYKDCGFNSPSNKPFKPIGKLADVDLIFSQIIQKFNIRKQITNTTPSGNIDHASETLSEFPKSNEPESEKMKRQIKEFKNVFYQIRPEDAIYNQLQSRLETIKDHEIKKSNNGNVNNDEMNKGADQVLDSAIITEDSNYKKLLKTSQSWQQISKSPKHGMNNFHMQIKKSNQMVKMMKIGSQNLHNLMQDIPNLDTQHNKPYYFLRNNSSPSLRIMTATTISRPNLRCITSEGGKHPKNFVDNHNCDSSSSPQKQGILDRRKTIPEKIPRQTTSSMTTRPSISSKFMKKPKHGNQEYFELTDSANNLFLTETSCDAVNYTSLARGKLPFNNLNKNDKSNANLTKDTISNGIKAPNNNNQMMPLSKIFGSNQKDISIDTHDLSHIKAPSEFKNKTEIEKLNAFNKPQTPNSITRLVNGIHLNNETDFQLKIEKNSDKANNTQPFDQFIATTPISEIGSNVHVPEFLSYREYLKSAGMRKRNQNMTKSFYRLSSNMNGCITNNDSELKYAEPLVGTRFTNNHDYSSLTDQDKKHLYITSPAFHHNVTNQHSNIENIDQFSINQFRINTPTESNSLGTTNQILFRKSPIGFDNSSPFVENSSIVSSKLEQKIIIPSLREQMKKSTKDIETHPMMNMFTKEISKNDIISRIKTSLNDFHAKKQKQNTIKQSKVQSIKKEKTYEGVKAINSNPSKPKNLRNYKVIDEEHHLNTLMNLKNIYKQIENDHEYLDNKLNSLMNTYKSSHSAILEFKSKNIINKNMLKDHQPRHNVSSSLLRRDHNDSNAIKKFACTSKVDDNDGDIKWYHHLIWEICTNHNNLDDNQCLNKNNLNEGIYLIFDKLKEFIESGIKINKYTCLKLLENLDILDNDIKLINQNLIDIIQKIMKHAGLKTDEFISYMNNKGLLYNVIKAFPNE